MFVSSSMSAGRITGFSFEYKVIEELWTTTMALKYFVKLEVWCLKWRMFADV